MREPIMLSRQSVFPTCDAQTAQTSMTAGSDAASRNPRWYSARLVLQGPGSAELSIESTRSSSAHCATVRFGGGRRIASASENPSAASCQRASANHFASVREFGESLVDEPPKELLCLDVAPCNPNLRRRL